MPKHLNCEKVISFNIGMRIDIEPNGKLAQQASHSGPGDYILLQAKMDVIGAVSACPIGFIAQLKGGPNEQRTDKSA